jgi:hypothetical protein
LSGETTRAVELYRRALSMDPNLHEAENGLTRILEQTNE